MMRQHLPRNPLFFTPPDVWGFSYGRRSAVTLVNIDIKNAGYETGPDDRVVFYSPANRNGQGTIISTAETSVALVDGQASKELAPGPVVVQILAQGVADTRQKSGYVPEEGPVSLWDVVLDWSPALLDQGILAILAALDEALGQVEGAVAAEIGNTTNVISAGTSIHAGKMVRLGETGKLHIGAGTVDNPTDPANKQYVDLEVGKRSPANHTHRGSDIVSETTGYVNYSDDRFANQLVRLNAAGKFHITTAGITSLNDPTNKQYVDTAVSTAVTDATSGSDQTMWWN